MNITLIATCAFGLEALLKRELQDLGFTDLATSDGKITFPAAPADAPCLNINLRTADRVLVKLAEYPAADFDQLFDNAKQVAWEDWIAKDGKITVTGKSVRSRLVSVRTCQSMIKKVIVDRFKAKFRIDRLSETGCEFTVQVSLFKDTALLTLDTTGAGLNKRGYRTGVGEAPLRENLAAALVLLSGWRKNEPLIDPMCGSGTILIEAAMIARRIAPGIKRTFAAEHWPSISTDAWESARRAARDAVLPSGAGQIRGFDMDRARISDCLHNAKNAGVAGDIIFEQRDVAGLQLKEEKGTIITNPPYGINIGELGKLPELYQALDQALEKKKGWALNLLTADKSFPHYFKRARPDKIRKLYNGPIEAHFFQYTQ